jgi:hypothetical protein
MLFSITAVPFYILATVVQSFLFVHILAPKVIFCDIVRHPCECEIACLIVLICIFQMINDAKHIFRYLLAIRVSSIDKCLFKSFAHYKNLFISWHIKLYMLMRNHFIFLYIYVCVCVYIYIYIYILHNV